MKILSTQAMLGAASAVLAAVAVATFGGLPLALGLMSAAAMTGLACVAFVAQAQRLRDEQRLVYRPVYARRQIVQRRVRSDD